MIREDHSSPLRAFAFRLKSGQDLKKEIIAFAKKNKIEAGCVITAVGSVQQLHIRFANQNKGMLKKGFFEITALVGTFSNVSAHLHLTLAGRDGKMTGGHLLEDTLVYTTAEIIVAELTNLKFDKKKDPTYGYRELVVRSKKTARKK